MSMQNLRMRPYLETGSLWMWSAKGLEMRSCWVRVGCKSSHMCPYERGEKTQQPCEDGTRGQSGAATSPEPPEPTGAARLEGAAGQPGRGPARTRLWEDDVRHCSHQACDHSSRWPQGIRAQSLQAPSCPLSTEAPAPYPRLSPVLSLLRLPWRPCGLQLPPRGGTL